MTYYLKQNLTSEVVRFLLFSPPKTVFLCSFAKPDLTKQTSFLQLICRQFLYESVAFKDLSHVV